MKLLLHICCAPCGYNTIQNYKKTLESVTGFWYNPNIHPYTEYQSRLDSVKLYAKNNNLDMIYGGDYGLVDFLRNVADNPENRCDYCYKSRLEACAKATKEHKFDAFSTTLLSSKYQNHDKIRQTMSEAARKYGVYCYYDDTRRYFDANQKNAREAGLYMQKFCGCIYSEYERYAKVSIRSEGENI